uniref:Uncharacterized protein n=1 Tax=Brassica campestris TaxID=3711 RepID=A0A3P5Z3I4_BRACM|nr:unnamed protein product [Brassica rapa]
MQEKSIAATLHHQIVYRIQDHALDLVLPSQTKRYTSKSRPHLKRQTRSKSLDKFLVKNCCADYRSHGCSLSTQYILMNEASTVQQKNKILNQVLLKRMEL